MKFFLGKNEDIFKKKTKKLSTLLRKNFTFGKLHIKTLHTGKRHREKLDLQISEIWAPLGKILPSVVDDPVSRILLGNYFIKFKLQNYMSGMVCSIELNNF